MRRRYRPVIVDVDGELFEVHLGQPGRPRVYRKLASGLRRVPESDTETLNRVAKRLVDGVRERQAREAAAREAEERRARTWRYRVARRLGRAWAWACYWLKRAAGPLP